MSENMMNRPVTMQDIANTLNIPCGTVRGYLQKNPTAANKPGSKVELVQNTAKKMGYNPDASRKWTGDRIAERAKEKANEQEGVCLLCGKAFRKNSCNQKYCASCKDNHWKDYRRSYDKQHPRRSKYWHNGNFKTREEEIARMKELRAMGYSNQEIAKAVGLSYGTVLNNIGKQDPELSKQNVAMGAHIRAQKNAARKQYVVNKPIREYNRKVEEHNALKAKVAQMEAELKPQIPVVEKVAQIKIDFPLIDLHTVQPTALQ